MSVDTLRMLLVFIVMGLVQVLILNHVHLFGVATPLLYIYFVMLMRRNYPKWSIMLWAFALGLVIDIFSNTPGVAAASLTFYSALQPYLLQLFIPRDSADDLEPSIKTLGAAPFFYYTVISITLFVFVFFALEMFSFFNALFYLQCVGGSLLITLVLVLVIENVRSR